MTLPPTQRGARDLVSLAAEQGVDLIEALGRLFELYEDVDRRVSESTRGLTLPCGRGCDACCHQCVFVTPLEFLASWQWVQRRRTDAERDAIVQRACDIYDRHAQVIEAFEASPPTGQPDHFEMAKALRFRCPLLSPAGDCMVYPVRELYARLFGCSFYGEGAIYGCELVGKALAGRTVTLPSARAIARRLSELPLTGRRQVYPHYIQQLYGPRDALDGPRPLRRR